MKTWGLERSRAERGCPLLGSPVGQWDYCARRLGFESLSVLWLGCTVGWVPADSGQPTRSSGLHNPHGLGATGHGSFNGCLSRMTTFHFASFFWSAWTQFPWEVFDTFSACNPTFFPPRHKGTNGAAYSAVDASFPGPRTPLPGVFPPAPLPLHRHYPFHVSPASRCSSPTLLEAPLPPP